MLMFKCHHCGSISNEPEIVRTKKNIYAECRWCGQVIRSITENEMLMIKEEGK